MVQQQQQQQQQQDEREQEQEQEQQIVLTPDEAALLLREEQEQPPKHEPVPKQIVNGKVVMGTPPQQAHEPSRLNEPPTGRVESRHKTPRPIRERPGQVEVHGHLRRPRTKVPKQESREQKFSRLATVRTRRAIRAICQLTNLAAPAYVFNEEQVQVIDDAVEGALGEMRAAYRRRLHGGRRRISQETEAFRV